MCRREILFSQLFWYDQLNIPTAFCCPKHLRYKIPFFSKTRVFPFSTGSFTNSNTSSVYPQLSVLLSSLQAQHLILVLTGI